MRTRRVTRRMVRAHLWWVKGVNTAALMQTYAQVEYQLSHAERMVVLALMERRIARTRREAS